MHNDTLPSSSSPSEEKTANHQLTHQILVALGLGIVVGLILHQVSTQGDWLETWITNGLFVLLGKWLISLLLLLVVPLVFASLMKGVGSLTQTSSLGRLSFWTMTLYLSTTMLAIITGLAMTWLFSPGEGMGLVATQTVQPSPDLLKSLIDIIPNNLFQALAQGNMLQIIIAGLLFGFALVLINREQPAPHLLQWLEEADRLMLKLVSMVMWVVPIGVFALMARSVANLGIDLLLPLLGYVFVLVSALLFHLLISYSWILYHLTGTSPLVIWKEIKPLWLFSFSTASSAASIPVTLNTCHRLGISEHVSRFTVPLGATINMDGTAIMQGVAAIFIANAYSVTLMPVDYLMIVITATLASIGTAAVPGAGLIMLTLVLTQAGIPVEGIALILGIDRLLDMLRTSVNVTGDVIVSYVVAQRNGLLKTT